jgi:hypothetical protein
MTFKMPAPVGKVGNWGKIEWAEDVRPQLGDKFYSADALRDVLEQAATLIQTGEFMTPGCMVAAIRAMIKEIPE